MDGIIFSRKMVKHAAMISLGKFSPRSPVSPITSAEKAMRESLNKAKLVFELSHTWSLRQKPHRIYTYATHVCFSLPALWVCNIDQTTKQRSCGFRENTETILMQWPEPVFKNLLKEVGPINRLYRTKPTLKEKGEHSLQKYTMLGDEKPEISINCIKLKLQIIRPVRLTSCTLGAHLKWLHLA